MITDSRIPYALRLVIFLLRVTLGLNFFYVGFTALFNPVLGLQLRNRSMSGLYEWLSSPGMATWTHIAAWAFLVLGICLVIGLFTRLASLLAISLILVSYAPAVTLSHIMISQILDDEVIVIICLVILIFSKAGTYIGLDKFINFSLRHKK